MERPRGQRPRRARRRGARRAARGRLGLDVRMLLALALLWRRREEWRFARCEEPIVQHVGAAGSDAARAADARLASCTFACVWRSTWSVGGSTVVCLVGGSVLAFPRYSSCRLIIFSLPYSLANLLYSQNILGIFPPKTFHTPSGSRKMELSRAKRGLRMRFCATFLRETSLACETNSQHS